MSSKVKSIIFYVMAALFVAIALTALIVCAISGELPIWLAIVLAVVEVGLFVSGAILYKKTIQLQFKDYIETADTAAVDENHKPDNVEKEVK